MIQRLAARVAVWLALACNGDLPALSVSAFGRDRNGEVYALVFGSPPVRISTLAP